jgi:hypothetical protein
MLGVSHEDLNYDEQNKKESNISMIQKKLNYDFDIFNKNIDSNEYL